jgi:hypothetical protein
MTLKLVQLYQFYRSKVAPEHTNSPAFPIQAVKFSPSGVKSENPYHCIATLHIALSKYQKKIAIRYSEKENVD